MCRGVFAFAACILLTCGNALIANQPVGIILNADGRGKIERPGFSVPIAVFPGVELFPGDVFLDAPGETGFAFCPSKSVQTLAAHKSFQLDATQLPEGDLFSNRIPSGICELPDLNPFPEAPAAGRRMPHPREPGSPEVAAVDRGVEETPNAPDLLRKIARARRLYSAGLLEDAVLEYDSVKSSWPAASWVADLTRSILNEADAPRSRGVKVKGSSDIQEKEEDYTGKTYALVIGTSHYQGAGISQLQYAAIDAETFARFLESDRGGNLHRCEPGQVTGCEIKILKDQQATLAAVSDAFERFITAHQGPENRLLIFLAGHGVDPVLEEDSKTNLAVLRQPVILTYDSSYIDTKITGYLMSEVRDHAARAALSYARVVVFADVCRAGNIGWIPYSPGLQPDVEKQLRNSGIAYFMASDAKQDSYESSSFGKGHGAFTYAMLESLTGKDPAKEPITYGDVDAEVLTRVRLLTNKKQSPKDNFPVADIPLVPAARVQMPTIPLDPATPLSPDVTRRRPLSRGFSKTGSKDRHDPGSVLSEDALAPDEQDSAWQVLETMRTNGASPDEIDAFAGRLRIALEDRGQQALLEYLQGDEIEPKKATFTRCAADFAAAEKLSGASAYDESRKLFCQGRALIFDKEQASFEEAERLLLQSIRLDSKRSYAYNALGIAYLEQASKQADYYARARQAFETAIRYAPYWTYPWHNLALVATETGNYQAAIDDYRRAMNIDPGYSYLPYNLGLLYQRLNRGGDARTSYEQALKLAKAAREDNILQDSDNRKPQESAAENALGALSADARQWGRAEKLYRAAITDDTRNMAPRHNLALMLTRRKNPSPEAESLWHGVLEQDSGHIAARLGIARYYVLQNKVDEAISNYRELLDKYPMIQTGRRELAAALVQKGTARDALAEMRQLRDATPADLRTYTRIADLADREKDTETSSSARRAISDLAKGVSPRDVKH
jgi:tetratricopeptide (TPR) repeat protein